MTNEEQKEFWQNVINDANIILTNGWSDGAMGTALIAKALAGKELFALDKNTFVSEN